MTDVNALARPLLNEHAERMTTQTMTARATIPATYVIAALEEFERRAPAVLDAIYGGIGARNAATRGLQQDLGIEPDDGVFGRSTAASVFAYIDENDIALSEYPLLETFLESEHPELYLAHIQDRDSELAETAAARTEVYEGFSSTLNQAFTDARFAILDRYYNRDILRREIETMLEDNMSQDEIEQAVMQHYDDIIDSLPDAIETEIRQALELEGVDLDDFVRTQIAEVFGDIEAEAAIENTPVERIQTPQDTWPQPGIPL